jgi:hypothetical protein
VILVPRTLVVVHEKNVVLSLHACRKTLRGGMPVVFPTTTKSTITKRRRKAQDRCPYPAVFSALHLFANKVLRDRQYLNSRPAFAAAPPRTASDPLDISCRYLRVCQAIGICTENVFRAREHSISSCEAVVQVCDSKEQDRQLSPLTASGIEKPRTDQRCYISTADIA